MNDMLGTAIEVGAVVLLPGGSPRYGGLNIQVGVVSKLTPKRVSLITGNLVPDGKKYKAINKTGPKLLVVTDTKILACAQVKALRLLLKTEEEE